jgi:hypothetical protein
MTTENDKGCDWKSLDSTFLDWLVIKAILDR